MLELPVAALLGHLIPAFIGDQPNHIFDFQPAARYPGDFVSGTVVVKGLWAQNCPLDWIALHGL